MDTPHHYPLLRHAHTRGLLVLSMRALTRTLLAALAATAPVLHDMIP